MLTRILTGLVLCGVITTHAAAQTPTLAELDERLKSVEEKMVVVETSMTSVAQQLAVLENTVLPDLIAQLAEMRKSTDDVADLKDRMFASEAALGELATSDAGGYRLNLLSKMASDQAFRDEVGRAVQGKITVNNYTDSPYTLYVNGTAWEIAPGSSSLWAPFGNVTTHLAPYEEPKQWTVGDWRFTDNEHRLVIGIQ